MTNQQHPITPAPELVQQWEEECESGNNSEVSNTFDALQWFASKAAHWGADQELEACCEWLDTRIGGIYPGDLRAARRPKPPNLKEQALLAIDTAVADDRLSADVANVVRRALEQIND